VPLNYRFSDGIKLVGFSLEGDVLKLYWLAERRPTRDYTVFVHLVNEKGEWVAGFDGMPYGRRLPNFSLAPRRTGSGCKEVNTGGFTPRRIHCESRPLLFGDYGAPRR
jgi:hypothetical protein